MTPPGDITKAEALAAPMSAFTDWRLLVACGPCRLLVQIRCDDLARRRPGRLMQEVVGRLRCSRCGAAPASVTLAGGADGDGRPAQRRAELLPD